MAITRCNSGGFFILLGMALLFTTFMALIPQPDSVVSINLSDKIQHLTAFFTLAFLADASWPDSNFSRYKAGWLVTYAIGIEVAQHFIPSRDFSLLDIAADCLGIALYALVALPLLKRWNIR